MSSIYSTLEIEDNTLPNLDAKDRASVHQPLQYKAIVPQHICCFFSPEPSWLSPSWVSRCVVVVPAYKRSKQLTNSRVVVDQRPVAPSIAASFDMADLVGLPVETVAFGL